MRVIFPPALVSYTDGAREMSAEGATVADLLEVAEARFPGIRFRIIDEHGAIRRHIKIFVNRDLAKTTRARVAPDDTVLIVGALSGG